MDTREEENCLFKTISVKHKIIIFILFVCGSALGIINSYTAVKSQRKNYRKHVKNLSISFYQINFL